MEQGRRCRQPQALPSPATDIGCPGDRLPTARHRATDGRPLARPDGGDPEPGQPARFEALRAPVAALPPERIGKHDEVAARLVPPPVGHEAHAGRLRRPARLRRLGPLRLHDVRSWEVPLRAAASALLPRSICFCVCATARTLTRRRRAYSTRPEIIASMACGHLESSPRRRRDESSSVLLPHRRATFKNTQARTR